MEKPPIFQHPFSMLIAGPTMSGKSSFTVRLLNNRGYIQPAPTHVLWCYGVESPGQFENIKSSSIYPISFIKGLPSIDEIKDAQGALIILDDLMQDAAKSKNISTLFSRGMHHLNVSIVLLVQNVFHQGSAMRDISLNASYIILFKNPRDNRQILTLSQQIFPANTKYLTEAYHLATTRPHGYLIINLTQRVPDNRRLYTNIFPGEFYHPYIPSNCL
jgi:Poxvirus A32 protein